MIKQGHKYAYRGWDVLALESGAEFVRVAPIDHSQPYPLGHAEFVNAADLIPQPMAYFHGELPS